MLTDQDGISANPCGTRGRCLAGAKARRRSGGTARLIEKGRERIIRELKGG